MVQEPHAIPVYTLPHHLSSLIRLREQVEIGPYPSTSRSGQYIDAELVFARTPMGHHIDMPIPIHKQGAQDVCLVVPGLESVRQLYDGH